MSTTATGRDWLEMRPAHFDTALLPAKHRRPDSEALWTVADLLPSPPKTAPKTPAELDGQAALFTLE